MPVKSALIIGSTDETASFFVLLSNLEVHTEKPFPTDRTHSIFERILSPFCFVPPDPTYKLQEVQEPMMQASEGMAGNNNNNGGGSNIATPAANPSAGPNTSALPNPWAAAG